MAQFISEHFTWNEVVSSQKAIELGIDNTQMTDEVKQNAVRTAVKMEKVRDILHGVGIHVDSWYRCPALNAAVGSKPTSQHLEGKAVDFIAQGFGTPLDICKQLIFNKDLVRFDQLILEHTWVHISFCSPNDVPRGEVLSLLEAGGYAKGLTDKQGNPV